MDDYSEFVPNVHFELIPIKSLVSNQDYQRNLSKTHIRRTSENFDLNQINPVKVSRRDGINYVFNGQHTIEIVATVSGSRDTPVWCMIYDELDYTQEADTFANQQKFVKPLVPYELCMANREAGNDEQPMIKSLVESYGLQVGYSRSPGVICAVSSLEFIQEKYGFHVLDRTIRLCVGTWEGEMNSLSSNMLKGIARLIVAFEDEMRDDVFKDKVGRYSAKEISRAAKERKVGSLGYAEAILIAYKRKMKNTLRWAKLYTCKGEMPDDIDFREMDAGAESEEEYEQSSIEG